MPRKIETRTQMLFVSALFEGLQYEEYTNRRNQFSLDGIPRSGVIIWAFDEEGFDEIVGHVQYFPMKYKKRYDISRKMITPEQADDSEKLAGSFIEYLGYGEGIVDPTIPELKSKYPNLGRDLMIWTRQNVEAPFYGDILNANLRNVLRAKPVQLYGPSGLQVDRIYR